MKVTPLDQRVLIKLDPTETTTAGGIILPDSVSDRDKMATVMGEILDMGENAYVEMAQKPTIGERVLITKYAGREVNVDKEDQTHYRIVNDSDVIAVLS